MIQTLTKVQRKKHVTCRYMSPYMPAYIIVFILDMHNNFLCWICIVNFQVYFYQFIFILLM